MRDQIKHTILIGFTLAVFFPSLGIACSMYKITKDGKTIVGNNEDWLSPNHQFWFEIGSKNTFGVMYMGQLDNFAQGAINEKGLVFDGFFEPEYLPVTNTEGKLDIPIAEALRYVMQTMSNVEEVKTYIETINLSTLTQSMLVFVDKSGTYLIVEGDEVFMGEDSEKTFSNFYYSQIDSLDDVNLSYYQNGRKFINATKSKSTLNYCSEAMCNFAQPKTKIATTQYSTIYDLEELKIRVYLFNDFTDFIEIDLKKELEKGNHRTMIPELFSKQSSGYLHYKKYNNSEDPALFLKEIIGDVEISEKEFLDSGIDVIITTIGYEWLNDIKNPEGAIKVFKYGLELMPNHSNLYDSLGEAYYTIEDWNNAIRNFAKSLVLNPENKNAITMISKVNQLRTGKNN